MKTDFSTLQLLASYTINLLKEHGMIDFEASKRSELIDAMATEFGVCFATDEDIKDQAIEEVEDKMGIDSLPEDITESEMYNHARKEIIKSFNGENIAGLYLVESLHDVSKRMTEFLLESELIDDVFGSDDDIMTFLVSRIRQFSFKKN
jgi:hypothetical protein